MTKLGRPNYRQLRLLQFMREMPDDFVLAEWGDTAWTYQAWSAAALVEASGIYQGERPRGACLRDLGVLVRLGELVKFGTGSASRWCIGAGFRA